MTRKVRRTAPVAIILSGGLGTRLRAVVSDLPKPMIPVLGRPFLDYLLEYLSRQGVETVVLSTGHLGKQVESVFAGFRFGMRIRCVRETSPLGTGGAPGLACRRLGLTGHVLVLNGDSLAPFRLDLLTRAVRAGAEAALIGVTVSDQGRFGGLAFGSDGWLSGLREKRQVGTEGVVNAGIYLLPASWLLEGREDESASLERDLFPRWMAAGRRVAVVAGEGPFLDIGTPESLEAAPAFLRSLGLFPMA